MILACGAYDTHAGVDWTIAAVTQVTTLTDKVVIDAGAGTFGQYVTAVSMDDATMKGAVEFLSNRPVASGAGYRSNIGWFNPNDSNVTVTFHGWDADGTLLGSVEQTAGRNAQNQKRLDQLWPSLADYGDLYVTYTASAPIFVYGSVVDNVNGDAIYVAENARRGRLEEPYNLLDTGSLDGEPDEADFERAYPVFLDLYADNTSKRSCLYPGVREGIDMLKAAGYPLGCVTNKAAQFTGPLLKDLGVAEEFAIIISGDTLPQKKPDPAPLLHAADFFGIAPEASLMIGDSVSDVKAARAAGFQIVCMSYGYNHGEDIRDANPDAVIDTMTEILPLLEKAA